VLFQAEGTDPALATGAHAVAAGNQAAASGASSIAIGGSAIDANGNPLVNGSTGDPAGGANASGVGATAIGASASANGAVATALGIGANASGGSATALGAAANAAGSGAIAVGFGSQAQHNEAIALGDGAQVSADNGIALGSGAQVGAAFSSVDAHNAVAIGFGSASLGPQAVALGASATAAGDHAVALGADSFAGRDNSVSVGSELIGLKRQITSVADGTEDSDAATFGQLRVASATENAHIVAAASTFGGGALVGPDGVFQPPSYLVQGVDYHDVGSALSSLDGAVTTALTDVHALQQRPSSPAAGGVPTAPTAPAGTPDAATGAQVQEAVASAKTYADAGDATTLGQARAYTDQRLQDTVSNDRFNSYQREVSDRFHKVDTRLDRVGAMGTAMSQMAFSTQGVDDANRLGVGAGTYGGRSALAVGYSRQVTRHTNLSFGGAVSGSEATAGVGVGMGW
jgi:autotransporter adhesin